MSVLIIRKATAFITLSSLIVYIFGIGPFISNTYAALPAPGGIDGNIKFWVKADAESFSNGANVNTWTDRSGNGGNLTRKAAGRSPAFRDGTISSNFNPYIDFDRANGTITGDAMVGANYGKTGTNITNQVYIVYRAGTRATNMYPDLWDWDGVHGGTRIETFTRLLNGTASDKATTAIEVGKWYIGLAGQNSSTPYLELNGVHKDTGASQASFLGNGKVSIGQQGQLDSDIAEIIYYDNTSNSGQDGQQIVSYLALKYGITLEQTTPLNYLDSAGSTIFAPDSTYKHDIVGIGRDVNSSLDQRVTHSTDNDGGVAPILTVATDNDFTSENGGSRTALNDGQYLIFGHNGQDYDGKLYTRSTAGQTLIIGGASGSDVFPATRRSWKVTDTGGVGSTHLEFPNLPALPAGHHYRLAIDTDGDFTDGNWTQSLDGTYSGGTVTFNYDFPDNATSYMKVMATPIITAELVTVTGSAVEGNSGTGSIEVQVITSFPVNNDVEFTLDKGDGTAKIGDNDYIEPANLILTVLTGETTGTGTIYVIGDTKYELDETFTVDLHLPLGVALGDVNGDGSIYSSYTHTILNDDVSVAGITLSSINETIDENGGTGSVIAVLDEEPTSDVIINITSSDTGELISSPSTLTFTPTNWDIGQNISFTGVNDSVEGVSHTGSILVSVNDLSSANAFDSVLDQNIAVTLTNDDVTTPTASTSPSPAADGTAVTTSVTGVEEGATTSIPGMTCTPNPADASGNVECSGVVGTGGLDGTDTTITVTDALGNTNTGTTSGLVVDNTAPAAPTASTSPSPAADGTTVTTSVTGVEEGATTSIPGMTCTPDPADASGNVECSGVVGTGGLDGTDTTITVTDSAGNTNTDTDSGLVIDNTAPAAPSASTSPSPAADGTTVTTSVTGVEEGTSVSIPGMTCTPDPADASGTVECSGVVGTNGLDGTDTTITVTDTAGNTNTDTDSGLVVDNTAPAAPSASTSPSPAADGTAVTTSVTGVEEGTSVSIPGMTCTPDPADASGNVECSGVVGTNGLDGTDTTITVTDTAGNTNTDTDSGLVVDNTAPAAPSASTSPSPAADGTAVTTTVTGVEEGTNVSIPGMTCTPDPADASGNVECSGVVGTNGLDGTDTTITVTDSAGNTNTDTDSGLVVDNTAPVAPSASTSPSPAADGTTVTTTVTGVEEGTSVSIPGMTCTPDPADASGNVECSGVVGTNGLDGTDTTITVTDSAGNTNTDTDSGLVIDNTAPAAPSASTSPSPAADGTAVTTTVTGVEEGTNVSIPGMTCTPDPADASGNVECSGVVGTNGLDGTDTTITVTDTAGNTNTDTDSGLVVDNTAPAAPSASTSPSPAADGTAVTTTVTGVEEGTNVSIPGMTCTPDPADASGNVECSGVVGTNGLDGTDTTITVTDSAGNTNTDTDSGLVVDNTAPVAPSASTSPSPAADGTTVTTTVTGVEEGTSVSIPGMTCTPDPADASGNVECSGVVGTNGLDGTDTTITVTDSAGNTNTDTDSGLVIDNTAPAAPSASTSPSPAADGTAVTTTVTGVEEGTNVSIPGMTCTPDPADASGNVECSGVVGTNGLDGTDTTITVTDTAGNTNTDTDSGLVVDNTAPAAPSASTSPSPAADGTTVTTTVTGVEEGTSVSIPGMTCTPNPADASGNVSCVGVVGDNGLDGTDTTITVTDASGNTNTDTDSGLVVDNTAPAAPTASTSPSPAADGTAVTTTVEGLEEGATTSIPGMTCTPDPADASGNVECSGVVGTNGLDGTDTTITVTDTAGNTNTDTDSGLVVDNTAPAAPSASTSPSPAADGTTVTTTVTGVEEGTSVSIPGMTCTPNPADASGNVSCVGVVGDNGLDGTDTTITVTDASGNTNTDTDSGLVVDNTAPAAPTASTSPSPAADGTAVTTTVEGLEEGATTSIPGMTCTPDPADASGNVECSGVVGMGGLDGTDTTITVTDSAGNTNTDTDSGLVIDDTAPAAVTASTSPSPAKDGTAVTTTVEGVEEGATTSIVGMTCTPDPADASGVVSCVGVVGSGGLDGTDTTVTITDPAGNTNTDTDSGLVVDNTAPNPAIVNSVDGDTTDPYETADATLVVELTAEAGSSVTIPGWTCTPTPVGVSGIVECTPDSDLPDGINANITPTVTDPAGNVTVGSSFDITVDTTAPVDPVVESLAPNPAQTGEEVTLTLSNVEEGATVTVPGLTCTPTPADASGNVECIGAATAGLLDGTSNTISVADPLGNTNTNISSPTLVIDDTAPATVTASTSPNPAKDGTAVTTTVEGVEEGATTSIPGMTCTPDPADASGVVSCVGVVGTGGLDGTDTTVTITDPAGNTNTDTDSGLVVDNTVPTITTNLVNISLTNQDNYLVSGTCSENGDSVSVVITDGTTTLAPDSVICTDGAYSLNLDVSSLDDGNIDIVSTIDDGTNLLRSSIDSVTKDTSIVDNNAPVMTLVGSGSVFVIQNEAYTELGANAIDAIDGDISSAITASGTIDISTLGTYSIVYTSTDTAGNSATIERDVQVIYSYEDYDGDGLSNEIEARLGTNPLLTDTDTDGESDANNDLDNISPMIELGALNNGDGNNDGVLDAKQNTVSSLPNVVNAGYNTFELTTDNTESCAMNYFANKAESSMNTQDGGFNYDLGLWDFEIHCSEVGSTADIKIYLDRTYDTSSWIYRKHSDATNVYTDISSIISYTTETVGSSQVTVINYSVTDGGIHDEDGMANGTIIDPSGPAVVVSTSGGGGGGGSGRVRYDRCDGEDTSGSIYDGKCSADNETSENKDAGKKDISENTTSEEGTVLDTARDSESTVDQTLEEREVVLSDIHTIEDTSDRIVGPVEIDIENTFGSCAIIQNINNPDYEYKKSGKFIDENISEYKNDILKFTSLGIVDGYSDGNFKPFQEISRVEFLKVALISHCYTYRELEGVTRYRDMEYGTWQSKVIQKAELLGMINGDLDEEGNTIFRGDDVISKIEALKILLRISMIQAENTYPTEYGDISVDWHKRYVENAEALKLFEAEGDDYMFNSESGMRRENMIDLIKRLVGLY